MSKNSCAYCNARKGKRNCQALHGLICTRCCGQHRLRDLDCGDCKYLTNAEYQLARKEFAKPAAQRDGFSEEFAAALGQGTVAGSEYETGLAEADELERHGRLQEALQFLSELDRQYERSFLPLRPG